ncbi:hypothetical protein GcC1_066033 [Golovinomyces cichoracearum]|uniref:Uncharacterized protein n=1 Tax=Golovinomyces cichoracearum TaxID=62708 RepID=A0A420IRH4_9PEZI|nr:hypothetical protein GcC1_066033 [Golovinomyces cichoracearum]
MRHGPSIRTRKEHENEKTNLKIAEEFQEIIRQNAGALAAQILMDSNEEPKNIIEAFSTSDQKY